MLLFAPLARAAVTRAGAESLRDALERVLAALDVADAAAAFAAIVVGAARWARRRGRARRP